MENKQTAVEWLAKEIWKRGPIGEDTPTWLKELYEQAKEIEKQQLIEFAEFVATYPDKNKNVYGDMLHAKSKYDGAERTIDLLETFKSE